MDEPKGSTLSGKTGYLLLSALFFPLIVAGIQSSCIDRQKAEVVQEPVAPPDPKPAPKAGRTVAPEDARRFFDEYCTIEFDVRAASRSKAGTVWFLNSETRLRHPNNLTVMIGEAVAKEWTAAGRSATSFVGKRVRVSGVVKTYDERPEIIVNEAAQVVIVRE